MTHEFYSREGQRMIPMIYQPAMTNQIYAGNKWVTRRPFKFPKHTNLFHNAGTTYTHRKGKGMVHEENWRKLMHAKVRAIVYLPKKDAHAFFDEDGKLLFKIADDDMPFPYGQRDDVHWIRESFAIQSDHPAVAGLTPKRLAERNALVRGEDYKIIYKTDHPPKHTKWKSSIHMPRAFARGFCRVISCRIEPLHAMREHDAESEGIRTKTYPAEPDGRPLESEVYGTLLNTFENLWGGMYFGTRFAWDRNPLVWVIGFEPYDVPCRQGATNHYEWGV